VVVDSGGQIFHREDLLLLDTVPFSSEAPRPSP